MGTVKDVQKIAILSGRYEIPHPGHFKTIIREAARFSRLYVYVVDKPANPYPTDWAIEMLKKCCADEAVVGRDIVFIKDPRHFGKVTKEELADLPIHDVFLSANPTVTAHLRTLGENVEEIPITEGYSSSEIKDEFFSTSIWRT